MKNKSSLHPEIADVTHLGEVKKPVDGSEFTTQMTNITYSIRIPSAESMNDQDLMNNAINNALGTKNPFEEFLEITRFDDIFKSDDDYMEEAIKLPHIQLKTKPLYKINIDTSVLFTEKLNYYRLAAQDQINKFINNATEYIETNKNKETKETIKYLLKAVLGIIQKTKDLCIDRRLNWLDSQKERWKKIMKAEPGCRIIDRSQKYLEISRTEKTIYLHYVLAELARLYLELQDRCAYAYDTERYYAVPDFISRIINRELGNVFELVCIRDAAKEANKVQKKKKGVKASGSSLTKLPKTLRYYDSTSSIGEVKKKRKRVDIVFRWFNEWGWLDDETNPNDFNYFFEGNPRQCNLTWKGNCTILTILLRELINQPYIIKQKGCRASSLVEQQFNKSPSFNESRLTLKDEEHIKMVLSVLDPKNPLYDGQRWNDDEEDYYKRLAEAYAIHSGELRSGKHT